MATKSLRQVGSFTNVSTAAASPTLYSTYFVRGDTATLTWNGTTLPVIVQSLVVLSQQTSTNDNVLYTVTGDIGGSTYPAGQAYGPFVVPAGLLATR